MKIGEFFSELGGGITGIITGFGDNIQSQASYNEAAAAQIQANAAATSQMIAAAAEAKRRQQQTTLFIFLIVFGAPLIGLGLYLALKK